MAFFKKRSGALLVLVVVILLGTVFGVNRSLGQKMDEVRDLFSDGVYDETVGYKQKSIRSQLENRAKASLNLLSIGADDGTLKSAVESLRASRLALVQALEAKRPSPALLFDLDQQLEASFNVLYKKVQDNVYAQEYRDIMDNAARVIGNAGYNEAVRELERETLSRFPTNLLRVFVFADAPELFA